MLLHVQTAGEILHADVVDIEVVAGGDGAYAVENIFRALGARQRLNGDVGVRKNSVDRGGYRCYQLLGPLESYSAGQADREIGEIAVAGAANSHASNFEDAIHARNSIGDLNADTGRSSIKQRVDGAPRQTPAHGYDNARDEQGGDWIG